MSAPQIPKRLNKELSWLIGLWTGDNFSSREGTVVRNGKRSSGRFGINCNDTELVKRAINILRKYLKQDKIRIDIQIPLNKRFSVSELRLETANMFQIDLDKARVYKGSEWRRNIGYAAYVNNTALQRSFNTLYKSLRKTIKNSLIDPRAFLQGIADAEGDVNKVSRLVTLTTKDKYVLSLIKLALRKTDVEYSISLNKRNCYRVYIKNLKSFKSKIGFHCKRKQLLVDEVLKGNLMRTKDLQYMQLFMPELRHGATVRQLQQKTGLPFSTVGIVLRNLSSGGVLKYKKIGRKNHGFAHLYFIA